LKGTIVNALVVLGGSLFGTLLKKGIPERYQKTVMSGLALSVGLIGVQMACKTQNILLVIMSIVIGAIVGEAVDIDGGLAKLGGWLSSRMSSKHGNVGEGFVTASLVYCVGSMAVVGSIQDGLTGDATTLYAKSMLDGISAVVFSSSMGIGVAFSSISIILYQGTITLLASAFSTVLSEGIVREMTAVGGLLILGISLMMLEIKQIKVANLLPAIPLAAIMALFWPI
jgi:hypothetical protein